MIYGITSSKYYKEIKQCKNKRLTAASGTTKEIGEMIVTCTKLCDVAPC